MSKRRESVEHAVSVLSRAFNVVLVASALNLSLFLFFLNLLLLLQTASSSSSSSKSSSSSLKPITMGACLMLAALQARHLWQERPPHQQGQGQQEDRAATAAK